MENKNIASALVKAQKAFGPALKTSTNPHFRSRYADLSACVEAVIGGLNDNGIALIQQTHDSESGVCVETLFLHESGESLSAGKLHVPASKQDAQGYGSALTYARRYSLMAACGIAPEDDDGNAASRPKVEPAKATPPKAEPKAKVDAQLEALQGEEISWEADWWTKATEEALSKIEADANLFLLAKNKISQGQTWRDITDKEYQARINSGLERFVEAIKKASK
jgi:hypothetical protein